MGSWNALTDFDDRKAYKFPRSSIKAPELTVFHSKRDPILNGKGVSGIALKIGEQSKHHMLGAYGVNPKSWAATVGNNLVTRSIDVTDSVRYHGAAEYFKVNLVH